VTKIICGVDVSSQTLDACIGREGPSQSFDRTPEGIQALAIFCQSHDVEFVAMEATGGFEKLPFSLLWLAGMPCAIVNPRNVRRFAESMGVFEKADHIDPGVIAHFAEVKKTVPQTPTSATQQELQAMVTRLRQLTDLHTAQNNQRRLVTDAGVLEGIGALLALLKRQIRDLEGKIAQSIDADPLWKVLNATFRTIKGVAGRTVARLMAELPEIGTISGKQAAKLVGLAPLVNESGKVKGKRSIYGGRANVRSILFLIADGVRRYDQDFNAFHKTLAAAGKPKKVIRVALARKLLVRLNAKARDARKELGLAV
jgi:transposase